MGRPAKPWYRKSRGGWWTRLSGKMIRLGNTEQAAWVELNRLQAIRGQGGTPHGQLTVPELADLWLDAKGSEVKASTWKKYQEVAQDLSRHHKKILAREWRPFHIDAWLKAHPAWGTNYRHYATSIPKMISRWGKLKGWTDVNHLAEIRSKNGKPRPPAKPEDIEKFVEHIRGKPLWPIVRFMLATGCRPGEAMTLETSRIDWDASSALVVGKQGERVVWIPGDVLAMMKPMAEEYPKGAIFRNRYHSPWTSEAMRSHFTRITKALGLGRIVPYHCRGSFTTRAIHSGVDAAIVAKLLGHSDLNMLHRHYHNPAPESLKDAVERAKPR